MSDSTAEGEWQRRAAYGGPVFSDLDEALQDYFHKYLKERGCDEFLAETITEYSMYKEQKEYMSWLSNMKKFIGA